MIAAAIGGANDTVVDVFGVRSSHNDKESRAAPKVLWNRYALFCITFHIGGLIAVKVRCAVCGYVSEVVFPEEWVQHPSRIPALWMCDVCAEEWT